MERGKLFDELVTMNVKVERRQREALQKVAQERGRSMSSLVRDFIEGLKKET